MISLLFLIRNPKEKEGRRIGSFPERFPYCSEHGTVSEREVPKLSGAISLLCKRRKPKEKGRGGLRTSWQHAMWSASSLTRNAMKKVGGGSGAFRSDVLIVFKKET